MAIKKLNPGIPIIMLSGLAELPGEGVGIADRWILNTKGARCQRDQHCHRKNDLIHLLHAPGFLKAFQSVRRVNAELRGVGDNIIHSPLLITARRNSNSIQFIFSSFTFRLESALVRLPRATRNH